MLYYWEGVNDDRVRLLQWLVADGARVEAKQPLAVLETTKATFNLEAPAAGYLFSVIAAGADARKVYDEAKAKGIEVPFIAHIVPEDPLPFGGW